MDHEHEVPMLFPVKEAKYEQCHECGIDTAMMVVCSKCNGFYCRHCASDEYAAYVTSESIANVAMPTTIQYVCLHCREDSKKYEPGEDPRGGR